MGSSGVKLTILAGKTTPAPLASPLLVQLAQAEVINRDEGPSGFQLKFKLGEKKSSEYPVVIADALKPFSRVILLVSFGATPEVLMDGMITDQRLQPSLDHAPGQFSVLGQDLTVAMDKEERRKQYPNQSDDAIVSTILADYANLGLVPSVKTPPNAAPPEVNGRVPTQTATDRRYLNQLAATYGYTFFVEPGSTPMTGTAYWGPPVVNGHPQKALTVAMGNATNVDDVSFSFDAQLPVTVSDWLQDTKTNQDQQVKVTTATGPQLAATSVIDELGDDVRVRLLEQPGGQSFQKADNEAQGRTNDTSGTAVVARGTADGERYGAVLRARKLVGLRGAGKTHDGNYYVKQVRHMLSPGGTYKQEFNLNRGGLGAKSDRVNS